MTSTEWSRLAIALLMVIFFGVLAWKIHQDETCRRWRRDRREKRLAKRLYRDAESGGEIEQILEHDPSLTETGRQRVLKHVDLLVHEESEPTI